MRVLFLFMVVLLILRPYFLTSTIESATTEACSMGKVGAAAVPIVVPDNFSKIQDAIDAALEGDTVFVRAGIYFENLTIDKTINVIGENPDTTIIDGVTNQETIFYVTASNVNISGFTVKLGDYGIWLHECTGCNVSNNVLLNIYFHWGIFLDHSVNNVVTNNTILPGHMAIYASYSNSNVITGNYIVHNRVGIILEYSFENIIKDNLFVQNEEVAVFLLDSGGSILTNNTLIENYWSFHVWGDQLSHFLNDIDISNTVDGKPVYYWVNQHDKQVPLDAGYVGLVNCSNIVARNLNITHSGEGVLLAHTNNSLIENVSATSYIYYGINALHCYNNLILNNNLTKSRGAGMFLNSSSYNLIKGNSIEAGDDGLAMTYSYNNTIVENSISYNDAGITLGDCSNNTFYHNNIIGNGVPTSISASSTNTWDNGIEGNYWRHFQVNDTNHDGIEDSACFIDVNNEDKYPLIGAFHSFTASLGCAVNVVSNSTIESFECFESNNTMRLLVFGTAGNGFCRICVPHVLLSPSSINVVFDGGNATLLYYNYSLYDNGTHRWIYLEYQSLSHEIILIPELTSILILLVAIYVPSAVFVLRRRKLAVTAPISGKTSLHEQYGNVQVNSY